MTQLVNYIIGLIRPLSEDWQIFKISDATAEHYQILPSFVKISN